MWEKIPRKEICLYSLDQKKNWVNYNSDWTLERAAKRSQVDSRREHLQEGIILSRQGSREVGQMTFHDPAIPVPSVLAPWLLSHGGHIPSHGLEPLLLQEQAHPAALISTFYCALGSLEEYGSFCFPSSEIRSITTTTTSLANPNFLKVKGRVNLLSCPKT